MENVHNLNLVFGWNVKREPYDVRLIDEMFCVHNSHSHIERLLETVIVVGHI